MKSFWNKLFFENSIKAQTGTFLPSAVAFAISSRTIDLDNSLGDVVLAGGFPIVQLFVYLLMVILLLSFMDLTQPKR